MEGEVMSRVKNFKKIAVCNRGEVAVRIIRACRELGIQSVLLHSDPDKNSRAFRMADECVNLGGNTSAESYLDIQKNVNAAVQAGADAVHPGFGFLSENADFAEAVIAAGLSFIGPMPDSIRDMGDKVSAKKIMEAAGVPCIPGYKGEDQSGERLLKEAVQIGFPVLIKAAAGGGGRGMKVSRGKDDFLENLESAQRESLAAFGSQVVFLEKYLEDTKHIEFQVFGDSYGNHVHLFERECSVQRRHQKIVEEAPSPSLDESLREEMAAAAVRAAKAVNYIGAGTVEFLLKGKEFYFLEMNTRLQVEHPVTEFVTGADLVQAQIMVASGSPLPWSQSDLKLTGHSIECRLYAEDPYQMGMPSTGEILFQEFPFGPGRRFDFAFDAGDEVTSYYDPMIGKLITWGENRFKCLERMQTVLRESVIFGVHTNIEFLKEILAHSEFVDGTMTTGFIAEYFPNALGKQEWTPEEIELAQKLYRTARMSKQELQDADQNPWNVLWRNV
jgi:3-methylcrotonyl-CoA carboxylase alpha subunit